MISDTRRVASAGPGAKDIGEMWKLSDDKVREHFENEPGVLVIGEKTRRGRRAYRTLRIPESVAERVHRKLSNPELRKVG